MSRPLRQGYTRRALVRVAAGTLAATLLAACGERAPERIASSPAPSPEALPMPTMAVPTPTMAIPTPTATPPPTVAAPTRQAIATAVVTSAPDPTPSPMPLPSTPVPTVIARKVPPAGAKAVFFGDSISDPGIFGQYAPLVCQRYGWALTNADPFSPTRAGIRGTILQANDHTLSNGITTFPQRVWAFNPDVVVMFYGVNDYYYVSRSPTPTTPATWRTAVRTILTGFRALPTKPFVVVVGLPTLTLPLGPRVPSWATSEGDVQRQMDAITWEECGLARAIFVPLRPAMPTSYVLPDGVHPTPTVGQPFIAGQIIKAIETT